jgi:hypothetical protein
LACRGQSLDIVVIVTLVAPVQAQDVGDPEMHEPDDLGCGATAVAHRRGPAQRCHRAKRFDKRRRREAKQAVAHQVHDDTVHHVELLEGLEHPLLQGEGLGRGRPLPARRARGARQEQHNDPGAKLAANHCRPGEQG